MSDIRSVLTRELARNETALQAARYPVVSPEKKRKCPFSLSSAGSDDPQLDASRASVTRSEVGDISVPHEIFVHFNQGGVSPEQDSLFGTKIRKEFSGKFFLGEVRSKSIVRNNEGKQVEAWKVHYPHDSNYSSDEEDLEYHEIQQYRIPSTDTHSLMHLAGKGKQKTKRSTSRKGTDSKTATFRPAIGMKIRKAFCGGDYIGTVTAEKIVENEAGRKVEAWTVHYDADSDQEDMEYHDILRYAVPSCHNNLSIENQEGEAGHGTEEDVIQRAQQSLMDGMGVPEDEVAEAQGIVGAPYDRLQATMAQIQKSRDSIRFKPTIGMLVRKPFDGRDYVGKVTRKTRVNNVEGREVDAWTVHYNRTDYDSSDQEDMEEEELFQYRITRPRQPSSLRGRQMQCLELFCGKGVVSQEFRERKWKILSLDNANDSNATCKMDILTVNPADLPFVPDFIWASPPCQTYSKMTGNKHRHPRSGDFEKSPAARAHNFLFTKMSEILRWAKQRHPHLIVVIENPQGLMSKMPLMEELSDILSLEQVTVDYCAFGRDDKKPTMLWTNNFPLADNLRRFRCNPNCQVGGRGQHLDIQGNTSTYDFSAIPQPLAEEVAEYVHSKFVLDRIRLTKATPPG